MKINKVLLIRPNSTNDQKDKYVTFPLGLGYIAAVLKKENYSVNIIDLTLENVNYPDLANRIKKINPDIIGISALSYEYLQIKKLSYFLKEIIQCEIILGGHLALQNYKIVLEKTKIDICVIGEGELTVIELLKNLNDLSKVNGIAYKNNNKIILNKSKELINNLDSLPIPAYELFDIEKYSKMLTNDIYLSKKFLPKKKVHKTMSIETGRGCPFACNFCSKMFKNIRRRSVDSIYEEMRLLKENYDIDVFGIQDELLFFNKKYISEFCEKIKPLNISWYGNARIDTVDQEMIRLLVKNRCLKISYGVESGSEIILKNMNKKTTPSKIKEVLNFTLKLGMPIDMGLILGYPGENKETVQETIDLLKEVGYPGLKFRYITPYPGSTLYNYCIEKGVIKNEEKYLEELGDGSGPYRARINFTEFTDEQLTNLVPETTKKVFRNYIFYLLKNPKFLFRYLLHKDYMNPIYFIYNRWLHPTNYDKAAKKRVKIKI